MNDANFGYRIVGPCTGERRLVDWHVAFTAYAACDERARCDSEAYLSAFTFGVDFRDHLKATGSTKGYVGPCGASWLWWDIDRPEDLETARIDSARLAVTLRERYVVSDDDLLVFYSGFKGFHLGLPVSLWHPSPGVGFHRIARRFCEAVAEAAEVAIDTGIYDAVRAFRAPNSRHPRTGLHKRCLPVDALMHLDAAAIVKLANTPEAFEVPRPTADGCELKIINDWEAATAYVHGQEQAKSRRLEGVATGATPLALNRMTLAFIRDGAKPGDRHRLLYSAARNLGDLRCPTALAVALLTEAALDSGLSPSDVRRQIDCGLNDSMPALAGKGGDA